MKKNVFTINQVNGCKVEVWLVKFDSKRELFRYEAKCMRDGVTYVEPIYVHTGETPVEIFDRVWHYANTRMVEDMDTAVQMDKDYEFYR